MLNANGCGPCCSCCCCDGKKCTNADIIEIDMDPPFLYNCCGCSKRGCCGGRCQSKANKIILSTDDIDGLLQHLKSKNVEQAGVELTVGQTNTVNT